MKTALKHSLAAAVVGTALMTSLFAEGNPPGYVDFGKFTPSASADQFVEVKLNEGLIQMASKIARKHEADVADLLKNVQSVRVNVVGVADDNRVETTEKAAAIRKDLEGKGWDRIVNAREKDGDVSIYLKTRNADTVEGIVITVLNDRDEAVFINVVGDVKLDQVARLGERLNLGPLKDVGRIIEQEAGAGAAAKEEPKKEEPKKEEPKN